MTTSKILESIRNGAPVSRQLKQEWDKKGPEEKVSAGRTLLYGVVAPSLAETSEPEHIQEVTAFFESLFEDVEQKTRSRSGSRQTTSS